MQETSNRRLRHFVDYHYMPLMRRSVANRYLTLASFVALLILSGGLLAGGAGPVGLSHDTPSEFLRAELRLANGTPEERTLQVINELTAALQRVETQYQRETGSLQKMAS